jgi:hypothetical protein
MLTVRTIEAKITAFSYFGSQKVINFVRPKREPDSGLKKQKIHEVVLQRESGTKKVSPSELTTAGLKRHECNYKVTLFPNFMSPAKHCSYVMSRT